MTSGFVAQARLFTADGSPRPDLPSGWRKDLDGLAPWRAVAGRQGGQACLRADHPSAVLLLESCASTLDVARERHAAGCLEDWAAVFSLTQTSGRGQTRREWHSPPGNLYATVRLPQPLAGLGNALPVAVGGAIVLALESVGVSARLKWPNDVFLDGRKIAGVLIEERAGLVLAGIGVNMASSPPDELMRADASAPADHLGRRLPDLTPFSLWTVLDRHMRDFLHLLADDPARLPTLDSRLYGLGRAVRDASGPLGVLTGVDISGAAVLYGPSGRTVYLGGSLSFD